MDIKKLIREKLEKKANKDKAYDQGRKAGLKYKETGDKKYAVNPYESNSEAGEYWETAFNHAAKYKSDV